KYDGGSWGNVDRPANRPTTASSSATVDQLNRDRGARAEGTQRTGDYGSYRSGSSSGSSYRGSGSYSRGGGGYSRGGGGGARGGGGRRR
ncbi:MAG TPA: hypothetical protein VFQ51_10390, partial [Vicinamibacteria bacterium]|nr:hypothetical protein [Vicinamibacteria bacterium]